WIALQNAEQLAWTGVAVSINNPFPAAPLVMGPVSVAWNRVFVFAIALALIFATYRLINHTKLGRAMRATFQDRDTAALMGVQINRIHTATFALGSGLAAAAAATLVILAVLATVPWWIGNPYLLHVLIVTGIFVIAAMSLNLLLGYAGQLSLGHVAFFGVGAYASALTSLGFSVHISQATVWQ